MNQLSNLAFLDVTQNMLSGTMSLQYMPKLQYLTISNNQFEGTLDEILTCDQCSSNLKSFVSVENPLTGPLPLLSNFTTLQSFLVSKSLISGTIPTEYGLLSGLVHLDLRDNVYLTGLLPTELGTLSNLEYFNIGGSSISGTVPSEYGQLQSLTEIFLTAPFLSGTIPQSICAIGSLVGISYSDNLVCSCQGTLLCIPAI
jgi:Leucine-rich repeat (LRR) protein